MSEEAADASSKWNMIRELDSKSLQHCVNRKFSDKFLHYCRELEVENDLSHKLHLIAEESKEEQNNNIVMQEQ